MKRKTNIQLALSDEERKCLGSNKIDILNFTFDEIGKILNVSESRAKELSALAQFQQIPTIGLEFAKDLVFLGYYSIAELQGKDGATLTDEYEKKKGFRTDPCVEDQFRLVVDFALNSDYTKRWWDFTNERKKFRRESGYPSDRPKKNWTEV